MGTHFYTATSVDGFIATPDHSLEWLLKQDFDTDGPMNSNAFFGGVGALIMGAATYEWILVHDEGWGYGDMPTWVLTHRSLPTPSGANVRFVQGDVREVHAEASAAAGDRDVWVMGGGEVSGQFADASLLDELWVQWAPVTLGAGQPLMPRTLDLELLDLARNRDFVCARYRVVK